MRAVLRGLMLGILVLATIALPARAAQDDHATGTHAGEADHGDHEKVGAIPSVKQGLITAITSIAVFLIVLSVLGTAVWPRIVKGLDERASKITQEIASAEAARQQAKDALEEYERSLAQARAESQRMLEQAKADQQKLAAELRAKTDQEIGELRGKAMRDIESARRAAVAEIYDEAATLATHMASKILRREVSVDDQRRLVEESLSELRGAGGERIRA